ncbi:MAG: 50S ribosomal protein L21 [Proteobacteria bacterium]|nr:50S ribosomal protein L21 [Pseudomonadota bacterium]
MYAVIESGGKQYRVSEGQSIKLEKLPVEPGNSVDLDKILMVADGDKIEIGAPYIKNGVVKAEVLSQGRHDKVKIVKFRRRKHHRKQMGHRQYFTEVKITQIKF